MNIRRSLSLAIAILIPVLPGHAGADTLLCKYTSGALRGALTISTSSRCPANTRLATAVRDIYGDGAAGDLVVTAQNGRQLKGDFDAKSYRNITIQQGAALELFSGTTIRCTGTFTNNGTITVFPAALGSMRYVATTNSNHEVYAPPVASATGMSAEDGEVGYGDVKGGEAQNISQTMLTGRLSFVPTTIGGGGGGAGMSLLHIGRTGGSGGGTLVILSKDALVNNGEISARGGDALYFIQQLGRHGAAGGGGGSGGIIVLGSTTSVNNTASIYVDGGAGASSYRDNLIAIGPGGGGSGGSVRVISPRFTNVDGGISLLGGAPGPVADASAENALTYVGGGSGGSLVTPGGSGGSFTNQTIGEGTRGANGVYSYSNKDPLKVYTMP